MPRRHNPRSWDEPAHSSESPFHPANITQCKSGLIVPLVYGYAIVSGNLICMSDIKSNLPIPNGLALYRLIQGGAIPRLGANLWYTICIGKADLCGIRCGEFDPVIYDKLTTTNSDFWNSGMDYRYPPIIFHDIIGNILEDISYLRGVAQLFFSNAQYDDASTVPSSLAMARSELQQSQFPVDIAVLVRKNMQYISPITNPENSTIGYGTHPAAAIYEILTNTQWGVGISESNIDIESFNNISLSVNLYINACFDMAAEAREIINDICDQCDLALVIDNNNRYKLIDIGSRPSKYDYVMYDEDFISLSISKESMYSVPNSIKGTYRKLTIDWPIGDKGPKSFSFTDVTITLDNAANITSTGERRYADVDISMFGHEDVAAIAMKRKLQIYTYPKTSITAEVNSKFANCCPGDIVRITSNEQNIDTLFRIVTVEFPDDQSNTIKIDMIMAVEAIIDNTIDSNLPVREGEAPQYNMIEYEILTFPAFSYISNAASAPWGNPANVKARFSPGQEQSGDLENGVDFTVHIDGDKIILASPKFDEDVQANALGLLSVDVWEE